MRLAKTKPASPDAPGAASPTATAARLSRWAVSWNGSSGRSAGHLWCRGNDGLAVAALRWAGRYVLARIWSTYHESVNLYGNHSVDVDGELAKLDVGVYRAIARHYHRARG